MTCPLSIAIARGLQLRRCRASIACDRRSARAKIDQLIQASHDSPGSGSTLNQRVTRTRAWRLLQSSATARNQRLRKSRRAERQRGLPTLLHWPDPQRAVGTAAPLRRVSSRRSGTQRNLRPGWFKNRASQFGRCRAWVTLLQGHVQAPIRFITARSGRRPAIGLKVASLFFGGETHLSAVGAGG